MVALIILSVLLLGHLRYKRSKNDFVFELVKIR